MYKYHTADAQEPIAEKMTTMDDDGNDDNDNNDTAAQPNDARPLKLTLVFYVRWWSFSGLIGTAVS